jgi:hypothetical protein
MNTNQAILGWAFYFLRQSLVITIMTEDYLYFGSRIHFALNVNNRSA